MTVAETCLVVVTVCGVATVVTTPLAVWAVAPVLREKLIAETVYLDVAIDEAGLCDCDACTGDDGDDEADWWKRGEPAAGDGP